MTVRDLLNNGYRLGSRTCITGYVSRLITLRDDLTVEETKHSRWGYYYVNLPCFTSTRYHYRQYFVKDEDMVK